MSSMIFQSTGFWMPTGQTILEGGSATLALSPPPWSTRRQQPSLLLVFSCSFAGANVALGSSTARLWQAFPTDGHTFYRTIDKGTGHTPHQTRNRRALPRSIRLSHLRTPRCSDGYRAERSTPWVALHVANGTSKWPL